VAFGLGLMVLLLLDSVGLMEFVGVLVEFLSVVCVGSWINLVVWKLMCGNLLVVTSLLLE